MSQVGKYTMGKKRVRVSESCYNKNARIVFSLMAMGVGRR